MSHSWVLQDHADAAMHSARMTMVEMVTEPHRTTGDPVQWHPMMTLFRAGEIFGFVQPEHPQALAHVLDACIVGFSPDVITLTIDTYSTNTALNPYTGREWEHNELGEYLLLNPGCNVLLRPPEEQGNEIFVSDALNVVTANRAGDLLTHTMPYRIIGREIRWTHVTGSSASPEGTLSCAIRDLMLRPTIEHVIAATGGVPAMFNDVLPADDPDVRRATMDLSLARHLDTQYPLAIRLIIDPNTRRGEIFRTLPGWRMVGQYMDFSGDEDGT